MINMEYNLTVTVYDTSKTIDSLFNKMNEYVDLCDLNDNPINEECQIKFAYVIFQKSRAYLDSLRTWNSRQTINKTYEEMKVFMNEECQSLEAFGVLTVGYSLNQVQMIQSLQEHQAQMSAQIEEKIKINMIKVLTTYGAI